MPHLQRLHKIPLQELQGMRFCWKCHCPKYQHCSRVSISVLARGVRLSNHSCNREYSLRGRRKKLQEWTTKCARCHCGYIQLQHIGKVLSHITGCELSRSDRVMMLQKHFYLLSFFMRQVEIQTLAMGIQEKRRLLVRYCILEIRRKIFGNTKKKYQG